jgi:hypothetical protein
MIVWEGNRCVGILVLVVKSGSFRTAILTSRFRHCGEYSHIYWELSLYNQPHLTHYQIYVAFGTNIFALQKCLTSRQSQRLHIISICSTFYSSITLGCVSINTDPHVKHLVHTSPAFAHQLPRLHRHSATPLRRSDARSSVHTIVF